MPLEVADPASLLDREEEYLIFYASIIDGKMWCPVDFVTPLAPALINCKHTRTVETLMKWSEEYSSLPRGLRR
jgi:hypothetical protein